MEVVGMAPVLVRERVGDILFLRLSRPWARNAIDGALLTALEEELAAAAADPVLRIVVLSGAGGYFCAGGDLKERASIAAEPDGGGLSRRNAREGMLLQKIAALPQLVVAAVEGGAVGAGLGMLCASDLVLAHENSLFAAPEVAGGAVPGQISPHLMKRLGASQARRLLLTSVRIDAPEARRIGLVHEIVPAEAGFEAALSDRLKGLARADRRAIAATKSLLAELDPLDAGYPARAAALYGRVSAAKDGSA
jgi:isohexenylglutaconyl-CoA hydratase